LAGKRVVITRSLAQSEELTSVLRSNGAQVILLPLLRIEPPEDRAPLDAALRNASAFDWMILTSQNVVQAIRDRATALGIDARKFSQALAVAAVGKITAGAASAAGFVVSRVGQGGTAADLVTELGAELRGKRVFLPRSDHAAATLVAQLQQAGARVTPVVAYRTVELDFCDQELLDAVSRTDAILFFSPSAVKPFSKSVRVGLLSFVPGAVAVGAIGPVTQTALLESGMPCDFVAMEPSVELVVRALAAYFEKRQLSAISGVQNS
jgi:uroporphyrinogen III methyltransferase/synthase